MIDTIVIVGNGFDIWQHLQTSYWRFRDYYLEHRDRILNELQIDRIELVENGTSKQVTPVELIYGNPFEAGELGEEFWNVFETSLSKIDAQRLNLFFDKNESDLAWMEKTIENARRILVKAFSDWVDTIDVQDNECFHGFLKEHGLADYEFGDNCFFINFNYTKSLEERFGIDESRVFHIHGQCLDDEDDEVIFGHANHPQQPQYEMQQLGGRFQGLYYIESILYETDKHVQNHIMELKFELATEGIVPADIKHIYVLGHSLGEADLEYFDFLISNTTAERGNGYKDFFKNRIYYDETEWDEKKLRKLLRRGDTLKKFHNRLQYTIKQYGYRIIGDGYQDYGYGYQDEILPEEIAAIHEKYGIEQTITNIEMENEFYKIIEDVFGDSRITDKPCHRKRFFLPLKERMRKTSRQSRDPVSAMWHISCFSQRDVEWAQSVMSQLGCKNYEILRTIDDCLKQLISQRNNLVLDVLSENNS